MTERPDRIIFSGFIRKAPSAATAAAITGYSVWAGKTSCSLCWTAAASPMTNIPLHAPPAIHSMRTIRPFMTAGANPARTPMPGWACSTRRAKRAPFTAGVSCVYPTPPAISTAGRGSLPIRIRKFRKAILPASGETGCAGQQRGRFRYGTGRQ